MDDSTHREIQGGPRRLSHITSLPAPESSIVARLRAAGCVFAEEEAHLLRSEASTPAELDDMVERRVAGLPLEQILGWAEFYGLRLAVETGVFVPRRRTQFLAEQAIALASASATPVVVDLCCGVGAIGAAIAANTENVDLYSVDIQPAAVRCARRNIGEGGRVFCGDLFDPLPIALRGLVDVLVANAPYVPTEAIAMMPPEARIYEDHLTLDGGADGLDVQRRIAAAASDWLAPGGHLLVESSKRQAAQSAEIFGANGLVAKTVRSDELDSTVVIGARVIGAKPKEPPATVRWPFPLL